MSSNLNGEQRRALDQFLDGQISAGALSARLEQAGTAQPDGAPHPAGPENATRVAARSAPRPRAAVRPSPRRALAAPAAMFALLLAGGACAWAGATALSGSAPGGHRHAVRAATANRAAAHHPRDIDSTRATRKKTFTAAASSIQAPATVPAAADTTAPVTAPQAAQKQGKAGGHDRIHAGHHDGGGPLGPKRNDRSGGHRDAAGHPHGPGTSPGHGGGTPPGPGDGGSGAPSQGAGAQNPSGQAGPQSGGSQPGPSGGDGQPQPGGSPSGNGQPS